MFNVGSGELLVILLIALVVLGPDKLPEAARKVGRITAELRRMSQGFQQEIRQAIDLADQPDSPGEAGPSLPPAPTPASADSASGADPASSGPSVLHRDPGASPSSAGSGDASAA